MSAQESQFKAAMRCLTGHVCLITTGSDEGRRAGLTATAVCSVSAVPPMLLVCVNRANASSQSILAAGQFCVNVLPWSGVGLANHFASPVAPEQKFLEGDWQTGSTGLPLLTSALATFECRISQIVEAGTHNVFIADVLGTMVRQTDAGPLLYSGGAYGQLAPAGTRAIHELLWVSNWDPENTLNTTLLTEETGTIR
ncbi:flavin reductase family protein [Pandoraea oxalativorans]|uniref:Flavin reductase like domain-containing protein n=1 Tax=Pandoraea oxalativorans TaxID=573737 RepID=A0A0E3YAM5_9BURK|nr:flavin reductase family protein [Pandoraea oxalativorans]AKC69440.1 hypothetical protein MB84_08035 [Pandoraea oxalativorans]